jgi:hypothetical protein
VGFDAAYQVNFSKLQRALNLTDSSMSDKSSILTPSDMPLSISRIKAILLDNHLMI